MKISLLITLLIFSFSAFTKVTGPDENDPGKDGNAQLPAIPDVQISGDSSTWSGSAKYTESYFDKRIVQRPKTEVNQYLGDLTTSFSIPFPKGFQSYQGLNFKYNSSQYLNIGYGIGLSLEMPKIQIEQDELTITGVSAPGVLIKTSISNFGQERIKKVLAVLQLPTSSLSYYLNQSGEDSSLYVQITSNSQVYFTQIKTNGETWIFNQNGNPTHVFGIKTQGLRIFYQKEHISAIKDMDALWALKISYSIDANKIQNYNGNLEDKVLGVKNIQMTQGDRTVTYNFSYNDEYLASVTVKGSIKKIFQAEYAFVSEKNFSTIQERNDVAFKANSALTYSSDLKQFEWINTSENSGTFYVDLNGDLYLDKIVLNIKEINTAAQAIFKAYKPKCDYDTMICIPGISKAQLEVLLNNIPQKLTTYIAINENGSLAYKEDTTLSIKENVIKFLKFTVNETTYKKSAWEVHSLNAETKLLAIPKFIDIDNNGKKDIIICDNDSDLKNFDRSLSGIYAGQKQNSTAVAYYDFLTKNKDDIFQEKGSILSAFLVSSDRSALSKYSKDLENGKFHFVLNASKLTKVNFSEKLACNQYSMPIDYNNDGIPDLLTGNKVTLFAKPGNSKTIELTKEDVKKLFNTPSSDLPISSTPVEFIDLKNDGQLSFVEAFASYVDRQDRSLVYLQDGMRFKVRRPAPVKLMIKENVTFGGYSQVDYKYHNGSALVLSILFSPRPIIGRDSAQYSSQITKQPTYKKVYEYGGSRISDQFNILLGHKDSKESTYLENIDNAQMDLSRIQTSTFDQDFQNGPLFFLNRARKNGRVLKQETFEKDGSLVSSTTSIYAERKDLGENRTYSYLQQQKSFTKGNGKEELISSNEVSSPLLQLVYLTKKDISRSSSNIINSLSNYEINQDQYLVLLKSSQTFDENLKKLQFDVLMVYDRAGQLTTKKQAGIESYFSYDFLGRIAQTSDQRGKAAQYTYHLTTPLISDLKEDGISRHFDYDFVTNFVNMSSINSTTTYYKWSTDEVLLSLDLETDNKKVNLYHLTKNGLKFEITVADSSREYSIDGFGRIIEVRKLSDEQTTIEKVVTYNDMDLPIRSLLPRFQEDRASVVLSYEYDALGRQKNELLSGSWNNFNVNFFKTSIYDNEGVFKQSESLNDAIIKKSTFWNNERGQVIAHKTPSESVNFSVSSLGQILGVKEIAAKYSYDEFGKLSSTVSTNLPWDEMFQQFSPLANKTSLISGDITYDAYNRVLLTKNSSLTAAFETSFSYEQGLPLSTKSLFDGKALLAQNTFDSNRHLIQKSFNNTRTSLNYDSFDRLQTENIQTGQANYNISYSFTEGQLASMAPFIKSIEYDAGQRPTLIEFNNKVILNFNYDLFQKIDSIQMALNGPKSVGIIYNEMNNGKPSKLYSNVRFHGLSQKNKTYSYSENLFLKKQPRLTNTSKNVSYAQSNLTELNGFHFDYENDLLVKISHPQYGTFKNFVSPDKLWKGTCPENFKSLNECFLKMNADEFQVQGKYTRAIRVQGKIIGVLYAGEFYPALIDHLGSLIALVSPNGDSLAFERVYNEWGEKESVLGDKDLERNIPWAFAGLIQHPFFNGEVLQSETRQYIPTLGLWGSADNLVKWKPNALQGLPGNWSPLLYASGDPVNFIDPTGHYNIAASDGASFSMKLREELKVDDFKKWNSAEGLAYKQQAQKNLGKVILGGAGALASASFGGPALASGMAGARIAVLTASLEVNAARVSLGMYVTKNPERTMDVVNSSLSMINDNFFNDYGFTPGLPNNTYEYFNSIKKDIENIYNLYKD